MKKFISIVMNPQLFAIEANSTKPVSNQNVQTTGTSGLSAEIKTYYSDYLIDNASPELVHDQFGQKRPIPQGNGKIVEFRRYAPLGKALTPLTEGVTPDGQALSVSTITAEVHQYGGYVTISDILDMVAIDDNIVQATQLLGQQAGMTLDTITREVLNGGSNVQYGDGTSKIGSRAALTASNVLTVKGIQWAVRTLKRENAKPVSGGYFAGIIHPDVTYDLTRDDEWRWPHQYVDTAELYTGEIGRVAGVRFVETSEAKLWVSAAASSSLDVYSTLIIGANAYGVTEIQGGGLQHFVKAKGSAGTADPLDQRSTVGWKATKAAVRLVEEYMVRIETTSASNEHKAN